MTKTEQLKQILKTNGYNQLGSVFYKSIPYPRASVSYTFLGGGWIEEYYREFPAKEGWSIQKFRISMFFGKKPKLIY